ncbi:NCS cytosine-purine permease [Artomyces pyxidatus]|uniref:NCS cytosine-purine permease n=1 Tax=Artomyces pyxidatus TaxID=48021 RepID=A0ACB8T8U2_9AGAM|nr:NCS cytosine-purine permease [Artomyces pyxidatus]
MEKDPEKFSSHGRDVSESIIESDSIRDTHSSSRWPLAKQLLNMGVEYRGIHPVPLDERVDTQFNKIFFIWLSGNLNILSFSAGSLGPVAFGLGLRDSCLVILFFNLLCSIPPAYLSTWGAKLGMRQMCLSRFTFGYYGVMIPSVLALMGGCGFCILNCILGGQALASVSDGNLSWSVGIVIIALISLFVSFCGLRVLGWYERVAWFPVLIVFLVATGVGGKHFSNPPPEFPATAPAVLSFAATIAGFTITWATFSADYTAYFHPSVSSWRIFTYSYLGLNLPTIAIQCLGAAAAISAPSVPDWNAGYADGNVGGLVAAMLHPVGGFGKFLTVLLSLSVTANNAPTIYSLCLGFQTFIPPLVVVPRYVFSVLATAIVIPLSIVGQHKFYSTLSNFLGLIGYWAGAYVTALMIEHLYFHRGDFASYDLKAWNVPARLPLGLAALGAGILSFGLVIPCMDQVWFVGPIAKTTGDLGFEMAMTVTALLYIPLRTLEKNWRGI